MNFPPIRLFRLCSFLPSRSTVVLALATWTLLTGTCVWSQTVREQVGLLGMTHQQLALQLVDAQPVRSPRRLPSGAVGSWRLPDAVCEGIRFEQTLFFARQKLEQMDLVLLQAGHNPAAGDAAAANNAYAALVQSLRTQFGAELASATSAPEMVMDTASWVSGDADVMLFRSGKPDHPTVHLVIRRRQLVDAGEL